MAASFPPISTLEGMPRSAQRTRTFLPEAGEPVKDASVDAGIDEHRLDLPRSLDHLDEAVGQLARKSTAGTRRSSGACTPRVLTTTALPVKSAGKVDRYRPATGKFQAAITPTTPRGSCSTCAFLRGKLSAG